MDRGSVFSGHPCSVCVFISFRDCNWLRVLHAVDSLNVTHELRSKKVKPFCIMQTLPNDIS